MSGIGTPSPLFLTPPLYPSREQHISYWKVIGSRVESQGTALGQGGTVWTFSFSSWTLGELSKHSVSPRVTRRLSDKMCELLLFVRVGALTSPGVSTSVPCLRLPIARLAYPGILQNTLKCVCSIQSYSGCFTDPQGHWVGVFYLWCVL